METKTRNGDGQEVGIEKLVNDLKAVVEDGQELLKAGVTRVTEGAKAGAARTDEVVRAYPYRALGIIFGLGLLAGIIAGRGRSRGWQREQD